MDKEEIIEQLESGAHDGFTDISIDTILDDCPDHFLADADFIADALDASLEVSVLAYAKDNVLSDRSLFLHVVNNLDVHGLTYAPQKIREDEEIIRLAINKNSYALKYASSSLRDKKDIVLMAVSNQGDSLDYASENLQNNQEVVLAAIKNTASAWEYVGSKFFQDSKMIRASLVYLTGDDADLTSNNYVSEKVFELFPNDIKSDRAVIMNLLEGNYRIFELIDQKLREDRHFLIHSKY